jgi:hypothetical protein
MIDRSRLMQLTQRCGMPQLLALANDAEVSDLIAMPSIVPVLSDLAAGRMPLTHEALDELTDNQPLVHLRQTLVAVGALPESDELMVRLENGDEPLPRLPRGEYTVPGRQRLAAVAVLAEREAGLSAVQRLALVDAAAWWLSDPAGGHELAHALIDGACAERVTAEHVYLTLITPPDHPADPPG